MDDRDLVTGLAARATSALPERPGFLPPMRLGSSFVGEIADADVKQVIGVFGIPAGEPTAAGDAPSIRMAIHRLPGGQAAVIVGAIDDVSDKTGEWVPFDVERGRSLLSSLRCRPQLDGLDVEALAHAVSYLSWFAHEAPFVATLEAERVAVLEKGKGCMVVAAKARFGPV
ncbi:MAG: hypothetical protein AB7O88_20910 [Reyranellaceae bacterium]